jgi:hypothetical protein
MPTIEEHELTMSAGNRLAKDYANLLIGKGGVNYRQFRTLFSKGKLNDKIPQNHKLAIDAVRDIHDEVFALFDRQRKTFIGRYAALDEYELDSRTAGAASEAIFSYTGETYVPREPILSQHPSIRIKFHTFLYCCLRNACKDVARSQRKYQRVNIYDLEIEDKRHHRTKNGELDFSISEMLNHVSFSDYERDIVNAVAEGRSLSQVARTYDTSRQIAWNKWQNARKKILQYFKGQQNGIIFKRSS